MNSRTDTRPLWHLMSYALASGPAIQRIRYATLGACAGGALALGGCALHAPPATVAAASPLRWYAGSTVQLPHDGKLTDLSRWWQQQGDLLLVELIDAAQAVSPSIASARTRIEQARAGSVAAGAALGPTLDGTLSASRSSAQPPLPMGTVAQGALQASWEIDLFGGRRAGRNAAQAQFEGAQAGWHDARVSIAAEVANQYYDLRACEKLLAILRSDATSRSETARLSQLSANAGFLAPASAALARASAAEGNSRATQQQASCDLSVKALVALTALAEPELRRRLAEAPGDFPQAASIVISSLPAQTLAQRPDVFAAEREVAAASASVGSVQAQRYPRLSLSGSVGAASFRTGGTNTQLTTWSIGPLALTLPIFDGGVRAANVDAARARYEEAAASYRSSVRQAVREVEQALVILNSTASRNDDALIAVEGFRVSFESTEARYQNGLVSLVELEEVRRTRLAAEIALVTLQRERMGGWISLYRAAGGGWSSSAPAAQP
ncbi:MAG: efflux transporter outer membrane subunit [Pseudomonadota bacterium]